MLLYPQHINLLIILANIGGINVSVNFGVLFFVVRWAKKSQLGGWHFREAFFNLF
jgi:hypothetical protein